MIYTLNKSIVLGRKALGLRLLDLVILAVLSDGSKSITQIETMVSISSDVALSGILRLQALGLVKNHAGNYLLSKEASAKHYIEDDEDAEAEEKDIFVEVTEEALKIGSPSKLAMFWKLLFERTLGRTCPMRVSGPTLGQISSARSLVRTSADLMVCMEYVLWLRSEGEPIFDGWDVKDPTIGFFAGATRIQGILEKIMVNQDWATRRAKMNLASVGGDTNRMRRLFTSKEFKELEKYLV